MAARKKSKLSLVVKEEEQLFFDAIAEASRAKLVKDTKAIVKRGERALAALWLSVTTQADRARCAQVERAFKAIDREQADFKEAVDALLDDARKKLHTRRFSSYAPIADLLEEYTRHLDALDKLLAPTRIDPEKKDG